MTVSEFVALLKREAGIGDINNTTDRTTTDIILITNKHLYKIWRAWPWDWSAEDISISMTADEDEYIVTDSAGSASAIGQISELYVSSEKSRLKHITRKEYLEWVQDSDVTGTPTKYIKLGRNSAGNLKIRVAPIPGSAGTLLGWGKKRLTALTTADIASGSIPFIPVEFHDILFNFCLADLHGIKDKHTVASEIRAVAKAELLEMIRSEEAQPDEQVSSPAPDYIRFKLGKRGGSTVV